MRTSMRTRLALLVVLVGCGGKQSGSASTGGDGGPGPAPKDSGSGADVTPPPPDGDAGALTADASGPAVDAAIDLLDARDAPADAAGDVTLPRSCAKQADCPAGFMCETRQLGTCGTRYNATCVPRPTSCPAGGSPVCGCDGNNYLSDCHRQMAGVQLESRLPCEPRPATVYCGPQTCGPNQLCQRMCSPCGAPPPCLPRPDGGACPAGTVPCNFPPGAGGCQASCAPPPNVCVTVPESCRDVPTCECLGIVNCTGINRGYIGCESAP
jgi:Kazal-type serine protease inhibitor domain